MAEIQAAVAEKPKSNRELVQDYARLVQHAKKLHAEANAMLANANTASVTSQKALNTMNAAKVQPGVYAFDDFAVVIQAGYAPVITTIVP